MKNFKTIVWIFVVFLIQTVIVAPIHIFGACPSLVLSYVMCVMILENEFRRAAVISIVCAAMMGALGGRGFTVIVLFYVYSSIAVFSLRKKPLYAMDSIKALVWTFIVSALLEVVMYVIQNMTINMGMIISTVLPTAVINTVMAGIMYPILKKTLYQDDSKKKLLIT